MAISRRGRDLTKTGKRKSAKRALPHIIHGGTSARGTATTALIKRRILSMLIPTLMEETESIFLNSGILLHLMFQSQTEPTISPFSLFFLPFTGHINRLLSKTTHNNLREWTMHISIRYFDGCVISNEHKEWPTNPPFVKHNNYCQSKSGPNYPS